MMGLSKKKTKRLQGRAKLGLLQGPVKGPAAHKMTQSRFVALAGLDQEENLEQNLV